MITWENILGSPHVYSSCSGEPGNEATSYLHVDMYKVCEYKQCLRRVFTWSSESFCLSWAHPLGWSSWPSGTTAPDLSAVVSQIPYRGTLGSSPTPSPPHLTHDHSSYDESHKYKQILVQFLTSPLMCRPSPQLHVACHHLKNQEKVCQFGRRKGS